jgi:SAM-dependent methyltransferase
MRLAPKDSSLKRVRWLGAASRWIQAARKRVLVRNLPSPQGERLALSTALRHVARGKTLTRAALNQSVDRYVRASGEVLDLGGFPGATYRPLLKGNGGTIVTVDGRAGAGADVIANLESDRLPFDDGRFDVVLAFNLLEHLYHPEHAIGEAHRVLRENGRFFVFVPFLLGYHPDPEDFFRYSASCLRRKLQDAGFQDVEVAAVGGRFASAANLALGGIPTRPVRASLITFALLSDALYYRFARTSTRAQFPLGYLAMARRALNHG